MTAATIRSSKPVGRHIFRMKMKANSNIPQPAPSATDGQMHVRRNAVLHADCLACAENSTLVSCAFAFVFSAARILMAIVALLLLMLLLLGSF